MSHFGGRGHGVWLTALRCYSFLPQQLRCPSCSPRSSSVTFVARDSFGTTVAWLGPLIRANDWSARRELCNIALFRPTFSAFDSHMYSWTPFSLSVMLLLRAVYRCRYAKQRDGYATPSSGDDCSSFAYTPNQLVFRHAPKMSFSSCYNKWSVGYFGLKLHRHILWPILHLVA